VHLHRRELGVDVRRVFQSRPVELEVLARREMAMAAVEALGNAGQRAQLARRQQALGNRHAQHRRVPLHVQAVLQPQRAELLLVRFAGKKALRLVAEPGNAFIDEPLVDVVMDVRGRTASGNRVGRSDRAQARPRRTTDAVAPRGTGAVSRTLSAPVDPAATAPVAPPAAAPGSRSRHPMAPRTGALA